MPDSELLSLYGKQIGPIDEVSIDFGSGLNVLTGETGAGKTILLGALQLALGERDSRSAARAGTVAVAVFATEDREIALRRTADDAGRLRASINGEPASADSLVAHAENLVTIYGQHDSVRLRSRREALRLIDEFGSIDDHALVEVRGELRELTDLLAAQGGDSASREREIEFLSYQLTEFEQVAPLDGDELRRTVEELTDLTTLRERSIDLAAAVTELDGDDENAVMTRWASISRRVPESLHAGETRRAFDEILARARELTAELRTVLEETDLDASRSDALEHRVSELQALARKHGGTLESAISRAAELRQELADRERDRDRLAVADLRMDELRAAEAVLSAELRGQRESAAATFSRAVSDQLPRVALGGSRFDTTVSGDDGSTVTFLYSSSPSMELGGVAEMASGGELSRLLLAMSLVGRRDSTVAIYDEIDAGIGGATAEQIGECLAELAQTQQVIVVSHLATIAARAAHHFVVERHDGRDRPEITVRKVDGESRVDELSRMLSGGTGRSESRALATALLNAS